MTSHGLDARRRISAIEIASRSCKVGAPNRSPAGRGVKNPGGVTVKTGAVLCEADSGETRAPFDKVQPLNKRHMITLTPKSLVAAECGIHYNQRPGSGIPPWRDWHPDTRCRGCNHRPVSHGNSQSAKHGPDAVYRDCLQRLVRRIHNDSGTIILRLI
jgi:hypothetical protein